MPASPVFLGKPQNGLPILFVMFVIGTLWYAYVFMHLLPLLRQDMSQPGAKFDDAAYRQGVWQGIVMHVLTALFLVSYLRCVFTDPGSVPDTPEWSSEAPEQVAMPSSVREVKLSTGDRRHCKWCSRFKPDRCHHCRVCNRCILKMDHHCPWVANCIGFRNQKFFALLVFYGTIVCIFVTCTMAGTVIDSPNQEMVVSQRFLLVFAGSMGVIVGCAITCFFIFHSTIASRAMTTVEFCEKSVWQKSLYDQGLYANIAAVLGDQPLLWLLPVASCAGDGVTWHVNDEGLGDKLIESEQDVKK